jgi:hypothetical protein
LIQPSPYDDVTRAPKFEGGYNQVLERYGEFVRTLAEKEGATVADLNTSVVKAIRKAVQLNPTGAQDLIKDRVHPGPGGQLLMAAALLKAWNAPALISTLELDGSGGKVIKESNTKVDDLKVNGAMTWTQLDAVLPMPIDKKNAAIALAVKASEIETDLNQQTLKVSSLPAERYGLMIDGQKVCDLTRKQLESGVNLAEFDTPMTRQAKTVHDLTLRHNDLHFLRWRTVQVPNERRAYPGLEKAIEGLDALEADLVTEQRTKAKPIAHRFGLVPQP